MWIKTMLYSLPLVLVLGLGFYIKYTQDKFESLVEKTVQLQTDNEVLKNELLKVQNNILALEDLNIKSTQAVIEAKRALEAFEDSNLNSLANSKPNLIENIINRGTDSLFEEFENESR